jgi:phosphate uptake regulator
MKRKVNLVGQNTLTVSLPSDWVKKNNIKKGDEIDINVNGDILQFFLGNIKLSKGAIIEIDKSTQSFTKSIISNCYKKGYDEIKIKYLDEEASLDVQKAVDSLLGMELLDSEEGYSIIKNVAIGMVSEFDPMLKKSFNLVINLSKKILENVQNNNFEDYENIYNINFLITKYTDFCKRLLNKNDKHKDNFIFLYLITHNLEKISNQYKYIAEFGYNNKTEKFSQETIKFLKDVNDMFELFVQAYYSKNKSKIKEMNNIKNKLLRDQLYKIRKKATKDDIIVIHFTASIIRKCADMTGPFFGIVN